jgi:hypothetical protein
VGAGWRSRAPSARGTLMFMQSKKPPKVISFSCDRLLVRSSSRQTTTRCATRSPTLRENNWATAQHDGEFTHYCHGLRRQAGQYIDGANNVERKLRGRRSCSTRTRSLLVRKEKPRLAARAAQRRRAARSRPGESAHRGHRARVPRGDRAWPRDGRDQWHQLLPRGRLRLLHRLLCRAAVDAAACGAADSTTRARRRAGSVC